MKKIIGRFVCALEELEQIRRNKKMTPTNMESQMIRVCESALSAVCENIIDHNFLSGLYCTDEEARANFKSFFEIVRAHLLVPEIQPIPSYAFLSKRIDIRGLVEYVTTTHRSIHASLVGVYKKYADLQLDHKEMFLDLPVSKSAIYASASAFFSTLSDEVRAHTGNHILIDRILDRAKSHLYAVKYESKLERLQKNWREELDKKTCEESEIVKKMAALSLQLMCSDFERMINTIQLKKGYDLSTELINFAKAINSFTLSPMTNERFKTTCTRFNSVKISGDEIERLYEGADKMDAFLTRVDVLLTDRLAESLALDDSEQSCVQAVGHKSSVKKKKKKNKKKKRKKSKNNTKNTNAISAKKNEHANKTDSGEVAAVPDMPQKESQEKSTPSALDKAKVLLGLSIGVRNDAILGRLRSLIDEGKKNRIDQVQAKIEHEATINKLSNKIEELEKRLEKKMQECTVDKGKPPLDDLFHRLQDTLDIRGAGIQPQSLLARVSQIFESHKVLEKKLKTVINREQLKDELISKHEKNRANLMKVCGDLSREVKCQQAKIEQLHRAQIPSQAILRMEKFGPKTPPPVIKNQTLFGFPGNKGAKGRSMEPPRDRDYHASAILALQTKLEDPMIIRFLRCVAETPSLNLQFVSCKVPDFMPSVWNDIDIMLALKDSFAESKEAITLLNDNLRKAGLSTQFPLRSSAASTRQALSPRSHSCTIDISIAQPSYPIFKTGIRVVLDPRCPTQINLARADFFPIPIDVDEFSRVSSSSRPLYETDLAHVIKSYIRVIQKRSLHRGVFYTDQDLYELMIQEIDVLEQMLIATNCHVNPTKTWRLENLELNLPMILGRVINDRINTGAVIFRKKYTELKDKLGQLSIQSPLCALIFQAISNADRAYWSNQQTSKPT